MTTHTPLPILLCNTGLGDFYVLSGAMVVLAKRHGGLYIPVLPQNFLTIEQCLINHPEIIPFKIIDDDHMLEEFRDDPNVIRCHWTRIEKAELATKRGISWDHWQYETLNVDIQERWTSCPLERASHSQPQIVFPGPYYLIHEDPERGFPISYPPWHPAILTRRIAKYAPHSALGWVDAIRYAKELHFIDSSFWHLAESITLPPTQPRYLHRYVRPWHGTWHAIQTRYHWRYLDGTPTPTIRIDDPILRSE